MQAEQAVTEHPKIKVVMSYPDLLKWTDAPEDGTTRVELLGLPRDPNLNDRLAFVICGPSTARVAQFMIQALETLQAPANNGPQPGV